VEKEARKQLIDILKGVIAYKEHPYRRNIEEPHAWWGSGSARLLNYSDIGHLADNPYPPVIFIPSLINRYYILDLTEKLSMARHLREKGFSPWILDWGTPGNKEAGFGLENYIIEYIIGAVQMVNTITRRKVVLAGYCMGGLMAMAAAQLRPDLVEGLAMLATPWDFHSEDMYHVPLPPPQKDAFMQWLLSQEMLPADQIHMLFTAIYPWLFQEKFSYFGALDPTSKAAEQFVAIEEWANDGVPLPSKVAKECLLDWGQDNIVARGGWRIGGEIIAPQKITQRSFIAVPKIDRIVPKHCAKPLAAALPHATVIEPNAGHIGMVVGAQRKSALWDPLAQWMYLATAK